ncbi:MAG: squalene--hopene cyclase [Planctomycetes bacterium]|nr:squalene--hopene cyclase [Planctomycetota bacterium]
MKIGMVSWVLGAMALLSPAAVWSADEEVTPEDVVSPGPIHPDEPFREEYSLEAAAEYLDTAAQAWQQEKRCFACHTDYPYMLARPAIPHGLATHDRIRSTLEGRVDDPWVKKPGPYQNSESVMVAAVLAYNDAATTGRLHPLTRRALDRMWSFQGDDGGWIWQKGNRPPSGVDDYYGTAMAAVAAGVAPDNYSATATAQEGLKDIRKYLQNNAPANMHNRAMLLWASTYVDGLMSDNQRQEVIDAVLAMQKPDGGWALATLGNWKRSDGKEQDYESSDGFGTGFVVYVLRRAGVPAEDPRIQKGVAWLKTHQRASGRWFTRSPYRDRMHYLANAGTAYAILALDACGEVERTGPAR